MGRAAHLAPRVDSYGRLHAPRSKLPTAHDADWTRGDALRPLLGPRGMNEMQTASVCLAHISVQP